MVLKTNLYNLDGEVKKTIKLPKIFETPYRPDLINRAFIAAHSAMKQPKGTDPMAGKRTTAVSWGPGHGVARVPRVKGSRYPAASRGAFAPMTVGGRRTHPPTAEKNIYKKINKKERKLALKSAIAATANKDLVLKRGHVLDENIASLPIIIDSEFENLQSTSEVFSVLKKLNLHLDLERVEKTKRIRAGVGKRRGRKYKIGKGPLIVVGEESKLYKAARNILGVDVISVKNLGIHHLAPGGHAGRLTIWTENALAFLDKMGDD